STVAVTAALLGKEVHSFIEPGFLRQVLPVQNRGTSARRIADVCRACFDSNPLAVDAVRAPVERDAEQPSPPAELHRMPQAGEQSLWYSFTQGLRHALRRAHAPSAIDQLPPPRPANRLE